MKKLKIIFIILFLLFIIGIFIYDFTKTENEKNQRQKKEENFIPEDYKKYIPEKGNLIFLEFCKEEERNNSLTKLKEFRQSLFYSINRTNITDIYSNLKPSAVLFTQDFFKNNKNYLPDPYFPLNLESQEIYKEMELPKIGFNLDKALNLLNTAWNKLSDSEKNQNYEFHLANLQEYDEVFQKYIEKEILDKIIHQINFLFDEFIQKNNLNKNQLIVKNNQNNQNLNKNIGVICLKNIQTKEEILALVNGIEAEIYFKNFKDLVENNISPTEILKFNLKDIKNYLDSKKEKGNKIDNSYNSGIKIISEQVKTKEYVIDFPPINSEGYLETTIERFWDFHSNCIEPLFNNDINDQLKQIKQKTYEEIFEKIFCSIAKNNYVIPIAVYIEN